MRLPLLLPLLLLAARNPKSSIAYFLLASPPAISGSTTITSSPSSSSHGFSSSAAVNPGTLSSLLLQGVSRGTRSVGEARSARARPQASAARNCLPRRSNLKRISSLVVVGGMDGFASRNMDNSASS